MAQATIRIWLIGLFILCVAVSAHAEESKQTSYTISIENMLFSPADITVHTGDTVEWINKDLVPHTVTAQDASFDSELISAGHLWQRTMNQKGSFSYHCKLHPTMHGTIHVEESR